MLGRNHRPRAWRGDGDCTEHFTNLLVVARAQHILRPQPPTTPDPIVQSRSAPFRVGLIGGLVLAVAVAAQRFATDELNATIGWMIVTGGMGLTGFYAAREAGAQDGKRGARAGAVGGLVAGILIALAYVAIFVLQSMTPEFNAQIERQLREQSTPQQTQAMQELGWTTRTVAQMAVAIASACCGTLIPIMSTLLGALGGVSGVRRVES
jgi:branched-subunit amino acid permease